MIIYITIYLLTKKSRSTLTSIYKLMNIWVRTSSNRTSSRSNSGLRPLGTVLPTITEQRKRLEDAEDSQSEEELDQLKSHRQNILQSQSSQSKNSDNIFKPLKFGHKISKNNIKDDDSRDQLQRKKIESTKTRKQTQIVKKSVRFNFQQQKDQYTEHSKRTYQVYEDVEADTASVTHSHYFIDNNSRMKFKHIKKQHLQSSKNQQKEQKQELNSSNNSFFTFQKNSTSNPPPPTSAKLKSSDKLTSSSNKDNNSNSNQNLHKKKPLISSIKPKEKNLQKTHSSIHNITASIRNMNTNHRNEPQEQDWSLLCSKRETSVAKTTGRKQNVRQHIISIIQYCSNEVGMAIYNTTNGEIHLCQIIERLTYFRTISTIQRFYPLEIIYSFSLEHTPLIKKLNYKFRNITFKNFKRMIFDQTKGFNIYSQRGNKQDYNPDNKFIAYSALNALIFYLENNYQTKFNYHSLNIKWHLIQDLLIIQSQTILELQIFLNAQTKRKQNCFIENFNCLTYGGTRMLRANILQPLSNETAIKERQDLVTILLQDKMLYDILCGQVTKFKNFQIITAKFIQSPKQQNMKSLKSYISTIYSLSHMCLLLNKFHQKIEMYQQKNLPLVSKLFSLLNDIKISELRQSIESNFDEQILKTFDNNRPTKRQNFIFLFKIQKLEDDFIQVLRITYSHTMEDILKIFKAIKQKSGFDLKLLYSEFKGYYIKSNKRINLSNLSQKIQDDIIQISEKKDTITFSTNILVSLNNRLKQSQKKLILLSQNLLKNIIFQIQKNIDVLFEINYQISVLDMVLSFVAFIHKYHAINFTKPIIAKQSKSMTIQGLKTIWSNEAKLKISKDINLSINGDKKMVILQKSPNSFQQLNFLYSIGYLTILTQIGCFVPADNFVTDIYHTILSKISFNENIESNLSHFQTQLYHFKNIIDNSTHHRNNCLILLDQFVKGTQYEQQISISLALISHLLNIKGKTFALISDKFQLNLTRKISNFPSLLLQQRQDESDDQIIKNKQKNKLSESQQKRNKQKCPIHFELIQGENNLQEIMLQLNFAPQFLRSFRTLVVQDQHKSLPF